MKFLADECCDAELVSSLRSEGYDVVYQMEYKPGALDEEVLETAFVEKRILLTEDKDFGELIYRLKKPSFGVIFLRFDVQDRHLKWPRLKELLHHHSSKLKGYFTVVESGKFRFRPL